MVKVGLVGLGGMGTVHHSNYQVMDGVEVVAATGTTDKDRENAKAWGIPIYDSVSQMVEKEDLDVVDVCTPTFLHKEHVMGALEKGVSVICEKPISLNVEDAKEMFKKAKDKGVHIYVGQVVRFFKEYQALAGVIKSQEYGKVLDAQFLRLSSRPRWNQGGWLFDKEKSGQLPFDLHIHDLDFIVSVFGKPNSFTFTSAGNKDQDFKEHYRFDYNFIDFHVSAEAAWYNAEYPWTAEYRVYFERAVMESKNGQVVAYEFDKDPRVFDTEERLKIPTGINVPPTGVYFEELSHFVDCLRKNKASHIITEEQLLTVLETLKEIIG
jgi:predicted dehydrogenase